MSLLPPPVTLFESPPIGAALLVLKSIGWPTDIVCVDFETYFDKEYSLAKLSTIEYIEDSRFEEIGVACLVVRAKAPHAPRQATFWWNVPEQIAWLQREYGENLEGCTLLFQNGRFDGTILVRKHGIMPPYVLDDKPMSAHLDARNSHKLKDMCERWGLPPKGDTMQFCGLHAADMTPEQKTAMAGYACNDCERETDLCALLLPRITRPEVEVPLIRHTLRLYWESDLCFDFTEAEKLIGKMQAQVSVDAQAVQADAKDLSGNKTFIVLLDAALQACGERVPMKQGKRKAIPALAKDDTELQALKVHRSPRVRALIKARQSVKSWPLHISRVGSMRDQARAAGGRLPNPLNYYGASTGRWSGGEGVNTTNLPTRGGGLQCEMKHLLLPEPGYVFVMDDAAQIEGRGTAWLAGQTDLMEAFAQGRDVYSEFASEALACPVRKPRKDDPPPVKAMMYWKRQLGKVAILGLGYNMGWDRFFEMLGETGEFTDKIAAGLIDLGFCKRLVLAYRQRYPMIPILWRNLDNAFRYVVRYGNTQTLRGLTLSRSGVTVEIKLPSGRTLFYPHAQVAADGEMRFHWGKIYGGLLTENLVQAMSRDILAEAILAIEKRGVRVAHHVYDSVCCAVPITQVEQAKQIIHEELTRPPVWAPDWPLSDEITVSEKYE